jgi:hypothetical protein
MSCFLVCCRLRTEQGARWPTKNLSRFCRLAATAAPAAPTVRTYLSSPKPRSHAQAAAAGALRHGAHGVRMCRRAGVYLRLPTQEKGE